MSAPHPAPAAPGGVPPRPRRDRAGTVMVLVLVGVIVLCLGLGSASYLLVIRVGPGGASPVAGTNKLLKAIFYQKDPKAAERYLCAKLRDGRSASQLITKGSRYQGVSWDIPRQQSRHQDSAKVDARMRFRLSNAGDGTYSHQRWRFSVVDENGWRVCGLDTSG